MVLGNVFGCVLIDVAGIRSITPQPEACFDLRHTPISALVFDCGVFGVLCSVLRGDVGCLFIHVAGALILIREFGCGNCVLCVVFVLNVCCV